MAGRCLSWSVGERVDEGVDTFDLESLACLREDLRFWELSFPLEIGARVDRYQASDRACALTFWFVRQ